jgi:hypothetical protein
MVAIGPQHLMQPTQSTGKTCRKKQISIHQLGGAVKGRLFGDKKDTTHSLGYNLFSSV